MLLFLVLRPFVPDGDFLLFFSEAPQTVVLTSLDMLLLIETANLAHSTLRSVFSSSEELSLSAILQKEASKI